jgi:hypothetical protein
MILEGLTPVNTNGKSGFQSGQGASQYKNAGASLAAPVAVFERLIWCDA